METKTSFFLLQFIWVRATNRKIITNTKGKNDEKRKIKEDDQQL